MQHIPELLGIAGTIAVGAISPGPSFVMVAKTAVGAGRGNGLLAALGMGLGGLAFAILALLGLHSLLLAVPSVYLVLKACGGLYLAYLGYRVLRGATQPFAAGIDGEAHIGRLSARHFLTGLSTQISNPKTAIVYASVFAAFLPADTSLAFKVLTAGLIFMIECAWYTIVAVVLSSRIPRNAYLRARKWIDRCAGGILIVFGLKLATPVS